MTDEPQTRTNPDGSTVTGRYLDADGDGQPDVLPAPRFDLAHYAKAVVAFVTPAVTLAIGYVTEASDGFNIMFPFVPEGLDAFVDKVVPELQRRGIFRWDYEGTTLRDHLGLPRPDNRFFPRA